MVFVKDKGTYVSKILPTPSSPPPTQLLLQHNKEQLILPQEVWILIWSFLDFKTLQKICISVSKSWMEMIRSSKLSWEVKLRRPNCPEMIFLIAWEVEFFNTMILSHWNNLRVIHFSSTPDHKIRLTLKCHKSLESVVIENHWPGQTSVQKMNQAYLKVSYSDCSMWGAVTKYWIDPRLLSPTDRSTLPTDIVKNVIKLKIFVENERLPEKMAMQQNECDLTNLETLEICNNTAWWGSDLPKPAELLLKFKNLKELVICLEIHADRLVEIVRFLGNTSNLKISVDIKMSRDYGVTNEEDPTKEIFDEALEILIEKFPFPDKRILKLKIFETKVYNWSLYHLVGTDEYHESPLRFSINYGESGATLTTFNTDTNSESENSDAMDESDEDSDNEDYMNVHGWCRF